MTLQTGAGVNKSKKNISRFSKCVKLGDLDLDRHKNGKSDPVPDWHRNDAEAQHCIVQYESSFS